MYAVYLWNKRPPREIRGGLLMRETRFQIEHLQWMEYKGSPLQRRSKFFQYRPLLKEKSSGAGSETNFLIKCRASFPRWAHDRRRGPACRPGQERPRKAPACIPGNRYSPIAAEFFQNIHIDID